MPAVIIFAIFAIIAILVLIVVIRNVQIVPQAQAYVIERFGTYYTTWQTGLHIKVPFIDRISLRVSFNIKQKTVPIKPIKIILKISINSPIN